MLKNVEETIVGIIISIENGLDIPPVKYNKMVSWNKSYTKKTLALKSLIWTDLILNCKNKFVISPKKLLSKQN